MLSLLLRQNARLKRATPLLFLLSQPSVSPKLPGLPLCRPRRPCASKEHVFACVASWDGYVTDSCHSRQSVSQPYSSEQSSESGTKKSFNPIYLLGASFFGLFGGSEDDSGKVPPSVKRQILRSNRALIDLDYVTSEMALHEALRLLAESPHGSTQPFIEARAVVLDMLANVYLEQNKLEEAEANFKETMRVMLSAGVHQEDEAMIEISLKLAKIYSNQKKYDRAGPGFEWCVKTAKKRGAEISQALYGMCVQGKGQYHLIVGEGSQAVSELTEAVKVAKKVYGTQHLQVAVLQNDLATALDMLNEFKQAEGLVRSSIGIAESLANEDISEELAIFYLNLGIILCHQGNATDALEAFNKAMSHAKKTKNKLLQGNIKREINATS